MRRARDERHLVLFPREAALSTFGNRQHGQPDAGFEGGMTSQVGGGFGGGPGGGGFGN